MKKIGLGISLLLFANILEACSAGTELTALGIAVLGLAFSIVGFLEKKP